MKLLQRHILWNVLTACAVAVGLFAGVLLLGNAMKDMVGLLLAGQLTTWMSLQLLTHRVFVGESAKSDPSG